jgi:DNA-binding winged helix-turn-helix (wHTH) protein
MFRIDPGAMCLWRIIGDDETSVMWRSTLLPNCWPGILADVHAVAIQVPSLVDH